MPRNTTSIFDHGATLVPDIVTEAEEERILLRISQAPWMTDLSRRVQHSLAADRIPRLGQVMVTYSTLSVPEWVVLATTEVFE